MKYVFPLVVGLVCCVYHSTADASDGSPIISTPFLTLPGQKAICSIVFSADHRTLATCASDGNIRVWSVPGGKLLFHRKENATSTIRLSADGQMIGLLFNVSREYRLQMWKREPARMNWDYDHPGIDPLGMGTWFDFAVRNKMVAFFVGRESEIVLLDAETGRSEGKIEVNGYINACAFSTTKSAIAIAYTKHEAEEKELALNNVEIWTIRDRKLSKRLTATRDNSLHSVLRTSHNGKTLAELWQNETVSCIDVASGERRRFFRWSSGVKDVAFTLENRLRVLHQPPDQTRILDVWDAASEKRVAQIRLEQNRHADYAILSQDGAMIATAMDDGAILLWRIQDATK
jgi:WD40 repeat protein